MCVFHSITGIALVEEIDKGIAALHVDAVDLEDEMVGARKAHEAKCESSIKWKMGLRSS